MKLNVNITNKTKLVEILRGYTYKITCTQAATYPRLYKLVPNKSCDTAIRLK